jgi:medium-chain acyl-[acyl-carrier-protein] hydrolase
MSSWFWNFGSTKSPRPRPRLRLFCFPYVGASATAYRPWVKRLPPDIEILAVQLPGRGPRIAEPTISRLTPLLDALQAALADQAGVPWAFFGHSMGALVAFELTRALVRSGGPAPVHLFLSGHESPQHIKVSVPIGSMSDEALIAKLLRYDGTPQEILREPELLQLILPPIRADFELLESWRHVPEAPLDVPVTVLGGKEDTTVSADMLEGWRDHVAGPFSHHQFPGGHFFIHTEEIAVLDVISRVLSGIR